MENETWLPVYGFPDYEVSNLGRVRSHKGRHAGKSKILKPWLNKHTGYLFVALHGEAGEYKTTVHSLVCTAFHGPKPSPNHEVAHWDGIRTNCNEGNLRWTLPVGNHADRVRHGTHSTSTQFKPTLTSGEVQEIRRLLSEGCLTQSAIAAKFGIWQTHVSHIKLGRRRKDL